jgi:hypothetical protein
MSLAKLLPGLLFTLFLHAFQPPTVDQVLHRIQQNVDQFEASLPDFLCDERIVSSAVASGKVTKHTVIESTFVSTRKPDELKHLQYIETRELIRVDGKSARKGQKPKGPFIQEGGFSAVLGTTFNERVASSRNYALAPPESLDGKPMLVITFATKEGQTQIGATVDGKSFLMTDSGKACIDPDSMQVVRLEKQVTHAPPPYDLWNLSVDYAPVTIAGKPFWMPRSVRTEITPSSFTRAMLRFEAGYSNYRKFDVTSGIVN